MRPVIYLLFFSLYGLVKYLPLFSGDLLRFLVLKLFLKKIRGWATFCDNVTIWFPENIEIEHGAFVGENCFLDGFGGIRIEADALIAHSCSVVSEDHGFSSRTLPIRQQPKTMGRIVIEKGAWIGCGVRILKGVTIGRGVIVGAGAVVTQDLPPFSIAAGVPARVIRMREGV